MFHETKTKREREREKLEEDNKRYNRLLLFVRALVDVEVRRTEDGTFDAESTEEIMGLVRDYGLTRQDFMELDRKPAFFGYEVEGFETGPGEWHYKLRTERNDKESPLFDVLNDNECSGA